MLMMMMVDGRMAEWDICQSKNKNAKKKIMCDVHSIPNQTEPNQRWIAASEQKEAQIMKGIEENDINLNYEIIK